MKQEVIEIYKKKFDYLRNQTKKDLWLGDIHEKKICGDFFELVITLRYWKSLRKFKKGSLSFSFGLDLNSDKKQEFEDYMNNLDSEQQRIVIYDIFDALKDHAKKSQNLEE